MTPFSRPSVSFLRKHNEAKRLQAIAFVVSSISSSVSLTSLNNGLQTCEANGCSAASSLLSTVADLLCFKCRRFTFGPRLTAGDQPYKCDIQTQQIRRPLTAASSHQGSNLSRSASEMMILPPATFSTGMCDLFNPSFQLLRSLLSVTLSSNKYVSWLVIPVYLPVIPGHEVRLHSQPHLLHQSLGKAFVPHRGGR